ncbi:Hypothetical_protein [Hexamita inflata]|uniref:Hypothetical_protein n=1 Tax=Hexamita inflata TaxID=28002 RepID=A0AA86UA18_9EUKA|nr:Hypothetical protein HINF_LOCUS30917 [Hexamita inflata]
MNQNKQFKVIIIGAFGTETQTLFSQLLNQNDYNWQREEFWHETVKYKNFSVKMHSPTEETNLISTTTGIQLLLIYCLIITITRRIRLITQIDTRTMRPYQRLIFNLCAFQYFGLKQSGNIKILQNIFLLSIGKFPSSKQVYCGLSKVVLTPKLGQSTRSLNVFKIRLQTKSDEPYWITHYSKTQNYNQGDQTYYHFNYHLTREIILSCQNQLLIINTITRNSPTQPKAVVNKKISKTNSINPKEQTESVRRCDV